MHAVLGGPSPVTGCLGFPTCPWHPGVLCHLLPTSPMVPLTDDTEGMKTRGWKAWGDVILGKSPHLCGPRSPHLYKWARGARAHEGLLAGSCRQGLGL